MIFEVGFVCGQRGMGKTRYILGVLAGEPRFLIFDHMGEFSRHMRDGRLSAKPSTDLEELADQLDRNAGHGIARLCYQPDYARIHADFKALCRLLMVAERRGMVLVVDEIDQFAGSVRPPAPAELLRVIHLGRHRGIRVLAAARRAADVSRALTSQADRVVSFRQTEPGDLKYLRSLIGADVAALPKLRRLCYLEADRGAVRFSQLPDLTAVSQTG